MRTCLNVSERVTFISLVYFLSTCDSRNRLLEYSPSFEEAMYKSARSWPHCAGLQSKASFKLGVHSFFCQKMC